MCLLIREGNNYKVESWCLKILIIISSHHISCEMIDSCLLSVSMMVMGLEYIGMYTVCKVSSQDDLLTSF